MAEPVPVMPLHAVLLPHAPLHVHVFEERYRLMLRRCLQDRVPFGVVRIREGGEVGAPATPVGAGTYAHVLAVNRRPGGSMNVVAMGTSRFRIVHYRPDVEPYPTAIVEAIADAARGEEELKPLAADVASLLGEYVREVTSQAGRGEPEYTLPDDPVELSFTVAALLVADLDSRQALLEATDTAARLVEVRGLLQAQVGQLKTTARGARLAAHQLRPALFSHELSAN